MKKLLVALGVEPTEAAAKPFGGLKVLTKISEARGSGATELDLSRNLIKDVTPLAGLTKLELLWLHDCNQITDLTPLAGLTKLIRLNLDGNPIPDDQKAMLRKALPNCKIYFD